MKITKFPFILAILVLGASPRQCLGQERLFNWLPANDESVRLDPANYHTGRTYYPGPNGGNIHVDIKAEKPVTIFLTRAGEWNQALRHPERSEERRVGKESR